MVPNGSRRSSMIRAVAAPSLLVCVLSASLYWQMPRLTATTRSAPEIFSGLAVWASIFLACVCGWQSLAQSRTLAEMERTLQAQGERLELDELEQAAEAMQRYAIFMLDPEGYIASWDRDAERHLGYTSGDAMERHFSLLYGEVDARQDKPAHDLMTAITEGRFDDERWMVRKDGFRFRASVALVAIRDPDGNLCGFTGVIREDVSESSGSSAGLRL